MTSIFSRGPGPPITQHPRRSSRKPGGGPPKNRQEEQELSFGELQEEIGLFPAFGRALRDFGETIRRNDPTPQWVQDLDKTIPAAVEGHRERNIESRREIERSYKEAIWGPQPKQEDRDLPAVESDIDKTNAQLEENRAEQLELGLAKVEQRESGSDETKWTPESRAEAERRRAELEEQERQLKNQLFDLEAEQRRTQTRMAAQEDRLFGPGGLLPGADDESLEALDKILGGDFNESDVTEVTDAIINSNLGSKEKQEQLGFIIDNVEVQQEILRTIEDLAGSRRDLDNLLAMTDAQLLGSDAEFTNAVMNWEFHQTPEGRKEAAFGESMEAYLEALTGSEPSSEVVSLMTATMDPNNMGIIPTVLLNPGAVNSPDFIAKLSKIVELIDNDAVTEKGLLDALSHGVTLAAQREQEWNDALSQDNYQPGTTQLGAALFQAAQLMGIDDQTAGLIADSQDVHAIIAATSGGVIGGEKDGSRYGIGNMTEEVYESLGYVREDTQGDPVQELQAFIKYIMELGGPPSAIRTWYTTGNWGG